MGRRRVRRVWRRALRRRWRVTRVLANERRRTMLLAEELLLLALRDKEGTVVSAASTGLDFGLRGALLAELALAGRLEHGEKKRLVVKDASPAGDPLLDAVMARMTEPKRPKDARGWVGELSFKPRGIRDQLLDRLVERGVLRREHKRILWVFSRETHPTDDQRPEMRVREDLRAWVLGGATPGARAATLIGLVSVIGLVSEVFTKDERAYARRRIKELAKAGAPGGLLADVVEAVKHHKEAAEAAAAAGAVVVTTAALHSSS